jgi:hypothetical protein
MNDLFVGFLGVIFIWFFGYTIFFLYDSQVFDDRGEEE